MQRTALFAAIVVSLSATLASPAAIASDAVSCVQAELTALGYDPGPVDGAFGRRTAGAFAALAEEAGIEFPGLVDDPLSTDNAAKWCAELAALFPQAAEAYAEYEAAVAEQERTSGFRPDIAPDVPAERAEEIFEGFRLARAFLDKHLGGDIPANVRAGITVKIVATGRGNQERGGGGGVATALAEGHRIARPFFDVAHEEWSQNTQGRGWTTRTDNMKHAAHEYTHVWQASLGAITINRQVLGNWMNEGLAEYIAYRAMAEADLVKWPDVQRFMARGAQGSQTERPLRDFGSSSSPAWPGHVGFLAIDWLVSETPAGLMALRTLQTEVGAGRSQARAFREAFGLELDDFCAQFETWREALLTNSSAALANRPVLRLGGSGEASAGASGSAPDGPDFLVVVEAREGLNIAAFVMDGPGAEANLLFQSPEVVRNRSGDNYVLQVKGVSIVDAERICVADVTPPDVDDWNFGCVSQDTMSIVSDYDPPAVLMKYDPAGR